MLLQKRPPAGIWGGLWCLPEGEDLAAIERRLGLSVESPTSLPGFDHRLSHVRMSIRPVLADSADAVSVQCTPTCGWYEPEAASGLGLPRPVRDLLQKLSDGEYT